MCLVCPTHTAPLSLFPGSHQDVTRASKDESQDEDGSEDEDAAARRESGDERVATFPATPTVVTTRRRIPIKTVSSFLKFSIFQKMSSPGSNIKKIIFVWGEPSLAKLIS